SGDAGIGGRDALPASGDELEDVGEGHVAERVGAGAPDGARHVGDAVMDDVFLDVGRVVVGRRAARFDASALVDGDVHDDGAGFHALEVGAADEARCQGARDEDGTDDEIGAAHGLEDGVAVGVEGRDIGGHDVVEVAEAVEVDVEDVDVGPEARGDLGG